MYGLLLEGICEAMKEKFGVDKWNEIREWAGVTQHAFVTHDRYSEAIVMRIARAATDLTDMQMTAVMEYCGGAFMDLLGRCGYDQILRVLGRSMSDFLNGLDNLHDYLRSNYPKMKSPSFMCENETSTGLTLHYRSQRKGYIYYVIGLIKRAGVVFFGVQIDVEVLSVREKENVTHVIMQVHFENIAISKDLLMANKLTSIPSEWMLGSHHVRALFPFHIWFGRDLIIRSAGKSLTEIIPECVNQRIDHVFKLMRPPLELNFKNVADHANSCFEMQTVEAILARTEDIEGDDEDDLDDKTSKRSSNTEDSLCLRMRGQMWYLETKDVFIYIGTPILDNLDRMYDFGLYIHDLSMHDASRDLILVDTQRSKGLKGALNTERQRTQKMEKMLRLLDLEIKRTDELLSQMIPPEVAAKLRKGESTAGLCQTFESVSVMFSSVVGFQDICNNSQPMEIVSLLNTMYTKFDGLTEKHKVYKVETTGDSYMVVAGAPVMSDYHALHISNMALDMRTASFDIADPSTGTHIQIRIGIHSGSVVAGIVGLRLPRYCLFGDTVNTASRMQSNAEPMAIQISEPCQMLLSQYPYTVEARGTIPVKGKGEMKTYLLTAREKNFTCPDTEPESVSTVVTMAEDTDDQAPGRKESSASVEVQLPVMPQSPLRRTSFTPVPCEISQTPKPHTPVSIRTTAATPKLDHRPSTTVQSDDGNLAPPTPESVSKFTPKEKSRGCSNTCALV